MEQTSFANTADPRLKRRRTVLISIGVFLLLLLVWSAVGFARILEARTLALAGLDDLEALRSVTDVSSLTEAQQRSATAAALRSAEDQFNRAHQAITSFWLIPYRVLPIAGTQVRSVEALAVAAAEASDVMADTIEDLEPLLAEPDQSITSLTELLPLARSVLADGSQRLHSLDLGPEEGLIGALSDARARFETEISGPAELLANGAAITAGLDAMLNQPNRYVVAAANNAEMRAGSGMWLMVGSLETTPDITLGEFDHSSDLLVPVGAAQIQDADLKRNWGWLMPEVDWRNLEASPRFPASAATAVDMWQGLTGQEADGVLVLDAVAMQLVLEVIGPITVGDFNLRAGNVVDFVTYDQYAITNKAQRTMLLRTVLGATFASLLTRDVDLIVLARKLGEAGAGRHLLAWSSDPIQQQAWDTLGVDGALERDSISLSVLNIGINKLDPYLAVAADLAVAKAGDIFEVALRVDLENETPEGLHSYVIGSPPGGPPDRTYQGILTLNVPLAATDLRVSTGNPIVTGADGETMVLGSEFQLLPGQNTSVTFSFAIPVSEGLMNLEPGARVPPISWRSGDATWNDEEHRVIDLSDLVSS